MTGAEILKQKDWLGKYIPIIKVVGKASNVGGNKHYKGLVRLAKDSLRAYNYWFSALTEKMALAPKAPFIGAVGVCIAIILGVLTWYCDDPYP